jgi:Uma2 family endonuclease
MGVFAVWIASELHFYLSLFARKHDLGRAIIEALFHLPAPVNRDRRPDVAFVAFQRWAKDRPMPPTDNAWDVVPSIAAEVVSPTDWSTRSPSTFASAWNWCGSSIRCIARFTSIRRPRKSPS